MSLIAFPLPASDDRPFYKSLARSIRSSIEAGVLIEGDVLPSQEEIARAAGVHIWTVGRAINILIREHLLIKTSNGKRIRVASAPRPNLNSAAATLTTAGPLRLEAHIASIEMAGDEVLIHVVFTSDEVLTLTTSAAYAELLEVEPGQML